MAAAAPGLATVASLTTSTPGAVAGIAGRRPARPDAARRGTTPGTVARVTAAAGHRGRCRPVAGIAPPLAFLSAVAVVVALADALPIPVSLFL